MRMKKIIFLSLFITNIAYSQFTMGKQWWDFILYDRTIETTLSNVADADSASIVFKKVSNNWTILIYDKLGVKNFELETDGDMFIGGDATLSDATPVLNFKDVSATAGDINATIQADATDVGDGTEDIDVTFKQQIAGTLTQYLKADADGVITIGSATQNVAIPGDITVTGTILGAEIGNNDQQTITLGVGATTYAVTSNVITVTGDGAGNTIATITGANIGIYIFIFVDGLITISNNDAHTANTIDLDGANNFTSADDKTLTLCFDGTSWYKVGESTN